MQLKLNDSDKEIIVKNRQLKDYAYDLLKSKFFVMKDSRKSSGKRHFYSRKGSKESNKAIIDIKFGVKRKIISI